MSQQADRLPLATRIVRAANPLIGSILRSPFHGLLSKDILLLEFVGRRSGRSFRTPVSFIAPSPDLHLVFTGNPWWRNLEDARAAAWVQGEKRAFRSTVVRDPARVAAGLTDFLTRVPRDGRFHGVALSPEGKPDARDVARAAARTVMIELRAEPG